MELQRKIQLTAPTTAERQNELVRHINRLIENLNTEALQRQDSPISSPSNENFDDKSRPNTDTDWIELGRSENVTPTSNVCGRSPYGCAYRVINTKHVFVSFNCGYNYLGSPIVINLNTIPEKYRPPRNVYGLCATNGRSLARVYVNTLGEVAIEWVQNLATTGDTKSYKGTWIDGYIDYWI